MKKVKSSSKISPKWKQSLSSRNANGTLLPKLIYNQLKENMDKSPIPSGLKSMYLMQLGMEDPITHKTALELYFDNWIACMRPEGATVSQRESVKRMRELFKAIEKMFFVYDRRIGRIEASLNETYSGENIKASPHAEEVFKEVGM
jgi:hypothetical protein